MLPRPQILIPESARAGDVIEIKTLITHTPEQPEKQVKSADTNTADRYIRDFTVEFEGTQLFHAKLTSKVSSNPYISFYMKAVKTGDLIFTWQENSGRSWTTKHHIKVS